MKKSKTFQVAYTQKTGGDSSVIVKGMNEAEAIANARQHVFTGSNFRNPVEIDSSLYVKPSAQGFQGSGRAN